MNALELYYRLAYTAGLAIAAALGFALGSALI